MKIRQIVFPILLLCAACSEQGSEAPTQAAPAMDATPAAAPAAPEAPAAPKSTPAVLYAKLPDSGLRFDFEFIPRSDKLVDAGDGVVRRGISIQYMPPVGGDIRKSLDSSMAAAGYAANADWQTNENGGSSRTFSKEKSSALTLTIVPDTGSPSNGGVIWIGWRVKKTAATGA